MFLDLIANGQIAVFVVGLLAVASLASIRYRRTFAQRRALARRRRQSAVPPVGAMPTISAVKERPKPDPRPTLPASANISSKASQAATAAPNVLLAEVPAGVSQLAQRIVPTQRPIPEVSNTVSGGAIDPEISAAIPPEISPPVERARARRTADTRPRYDVEFYVLYSREVSSRAPFTIYVVVAGFTPIGTHEKAVASDAPESFVTTILDGARVDIIMESDQAEIDAPEQSLIWRGRNAMAAFVLHPKDRTTHKCAHCKVSVSVDRVDCGRIAFEIDINPKIIPVLANPRIADRDGQPVTGWNHQVPALLTTEGSIASVINGFFCYSHKDWSWVSYVAEALESQGNTILIDGIDMRRSTGGTRRRDGWRDQAEGFIRRANVAYVFWSDHMPESDSIMFELSKIRDRLNDPNFDVVLMRQTDEGIAPPEWLIDVENTFGHKWRNFRAGMRENYKRDGAG